MSNDQSSLLFSPREIAAWQLPGLARPASLVHAALPALQRGAVWRPIQVEALWDSVLRGFPIGAFLLSPFDKERGEKEPLLKSALVSTSASKIQPTHHLLDGQQRSNALALGFLNPWGVESPPFALWVDLHAPKHSDERDFVLRLLTHSHPWGYRNELLASEGPRLSAPMIRDALAAYKNAMPDDIKNSCEEISLKYSWPWDAYAPIPLCLLIDSVTQGGDVRTNLLERLSNLPFWQKEISNRHKVKWQQRVKSIIEAQDGRDRRHMDRILEGVKRVLGTEDPPYIIAGLVVPGLAAVLTGAAHNKGPLRGKAEKPDAIETLFVRVNSGGTVLDGEELMFSLLKSIWPEAEEFIQALKVRVAVPSRIVTLTSRLVISDSKSSKQRPPQTPNVARFRRLIHGKDTECTGFQTKLRSFFESDTVSAALVFTVARDLLTSDPKFGLPPMLAANIARHSPNVMFLLLRWVQRMLREKLDPRNLELSKRRQILGAITSLSWFSSEDSNTGKGKYSVDALWPVLQRATGDKLKSFFSRKNFKRCFTLPGFKLGLLPLVPPKLLAMVVRKSVLGRGFQKATNKQWDNWRWDSHLSERPLKALSSRFPTWYRKVLRYSRKEADASDQLENGELGLHQLAWRTFIDSLWDERDLLMFAQRGWLTRWLKRIKYDPSNVDQVEESNRPWDFDHIHPESHVKNKKNVPRIVRDWHGSIGNLRAWPLQANRGDGDDHPRRKFSQDIVESGLNQFEIADVLDASFIDENERDSWLQSTPDEDSHGGYLGKPSDYGEQRKHLVSAIVNRWLKLYSHWYEDLKIGSLMP